MTVTVPFDTDPGLAGGTTLTNNASVVSREITTPVSDDGSYLSTVDSDVGIDKQQPAGPVKAGESFDYTLLVTNHGPSDATGVSVNDNLPANLTFVSSPDCSHAGANPGGTVTCTIGALAANGTRTLTVRVKVDPNETVGISNTATVSSTTPDTNNANNSSTVTRSVNAEADIRVEKSGPAQPVLQGTNFTFVIKVTNDGPSAATSVQLNDPLPATVGYVSDVTDTGTCSENAGTVSCNLGTLAPGQTATVTITAKAVTVGTATNTATATTQTPETTTNNNHDDADVTVLPAADLGVVKSAPAKAAPNSNITYDLQATNHGPSNATGVTLTDTLPAGVQFVSADPGCSHASGTVTCVVGNLANGASTTLHITVKVPFALGGQTLSNNVGIHGNEGDLVAANDTSQASTTVDPAADLSVKKTAGGANAGGTASWTLAVRNGGPSTASPVTVRDTLPTGAKFHSATPSQGNCSESGGEVVCDLGSMPSGGSAQITIVADVPPGTAGTVLSNTARVSAPQVDPNPDNNVSTVEVPIDRDLNQPDLKVTKTASTSKPQLGQPFTYKIVVQNNGTVTARAVKLLDTMSAAVKVNSAKPDEGSCKVSDSTVRCSLGDIASGKHVSVRIVVTPIRVGTLKNTASASDVNGEAVPPDNTDKVTGQVSDPEASWTLHKRALKKRVRGGDEFEYEISIKMRGKRAAADVRVCDRLPDGLVFVKAKGATFKNGQACWTFQYMGPGSVRKLRIRVRAERRTGTHTVRNVVVGNGGNLPRRSDSAPVRVSPAFAGPDGGVTG